MSIELENKFLTIIGKGDGSFDADIQASKDCASLCVEFAVEKMQMLLSILQENQQIQIADYYNDKSYNDEERKIRNAVIEEYRDMILIFKSRIKTLKP